MNDNTKDYDRIVRNLRRAIMEIESHTFVDENQARFFECIIDTMDEFDSSEMEWEMIFRNLAAIASRKDEE